MRRACLLATTSAQATKLNLCVFNRLLLLLEIEPATLCSFAENITYCVQTPAEILDIVMGNDLRSRPHIDGCIPGHLWCFSAAFPCGHFSYNKKRTNTITCRHPYLRRDIQRTLRIHASMHKYVFNRRKNGRVYHCLVCVYMTWT